MDPQSRLAEFSSEGRRAGGVGDRIRLSLSASLFGRVHFPRAERYDRLWWRLDAVGEKVSGHSGARSYNSRRRAVSGPRNDRALRGHPALRESSTGGDRATPVSADRSLAIGLGWPGVSVRIGGESVGIPPDPS